MEANKEKVETNSNLDELLVYTDINELLYIQEAYESLEMFLDDCNVPKELNGEKLSIVGRVMWYKYDKLTTVK